MGFWENFNASTYAYRSFANGLRNQRFSMGQIDGVIRQLDGWKREFDGLWASASTERNSAVAQSRLNETIMQVQGKIDKMLDLRNRLQNMVRETEVKIQQLEQSIGRLSDSLQHDRSKWLNMTNRDAKYALSQKINDKEQRLRSMEGQLAQLRIKQSSLNS